MTTGETYNGYTNRETWLVALWIDNDPTWYSRSREMARECTEDPGIRSPDGLLADTLKDWVKASPTAGMVGRSGLFADLLGTALSRVDWYEIAENYIEEVSEEVEG